MPTKPKPVKRPWMRQATSNHQGRTAPNRHVYDTQRWRKLSKAYRQANPLCECEECETLTVPLIAEVVDHKTPINQGGDPYSWDNLQSMNKKCHNKKSAKEK